MNQTNATTSTPNEPHDDGDDVPPPHPHAEALAAVSERVRRRLGLETLETRHRDRLDFHDLSVEQLRGAILLAFDAGVAAATGTTSPTPSQPPTPPKPPAPTGPALAASPRPTRTPSAADAYAAKRGDIARLLDVLDLELGKHDEAALADPKNWGHAGDLDEVRAKLGGIVGFLSGMDQGEVERFLRDE